MTFEDTQLLDHPTVRAMFNAVRKNSSKGWLAYAIAAAELISTHVDGADPEVVAAAIFLPLAQTARISPAAAAYAEESYRDAAALSEPARQVALAHAIVELRDTQERIEERNHYWGARTAQYDIDKYSKPLLRAAQGAKARKLAAAAQAQLAATQKALDDQIRALHATVTFEKSGLPDHPTLRKAFARIRAANIENDPLLLNFTQSGTAIARILHDTGASTDPDVLGAAILHAYSPVRKDFKALSDFNNASLADWNARYNAEKEKGLAAMSKAFSPRLMAFYRETGSFVRPQDRPASMTKEAFLIDAAVYLEILESSMETYAAAKKKVPRDTYGLARKLESLEDFTDYAATMLDNLRKLNLAVPAFENRMQKSVAAARKLMNAPANVKIRAPGSPRQELGW